MIVIDLLHGGGGVEKNKMVPIFAKSFSLGGDRYFTKEKKKLALILAKSFSQPKLPREKMLFIIVVSGKIWDNPFFAGKKNCLNEGKIHIPP